MNNQDGFYASNYAYPRELLDVFLVPADHQRPAKIRVTLNRPLTWAEFEHLNERFAHGEATADNRINRQVLHLEASMDSRILFGDFADFLAREFVNVFPTAVLTKQEHQ